MELFENWSQTKAALLKDLPESKRKIVDPLMENQLQYLKETAAAGTTGAGAIGNFQKIVIPMIRRIIPGSIGPELVGVQPMTGPVGLVYSLRFLFGEAMDTSPLTATQSTDITAGDEVFGAYGTGSKMNSFYSGIVNPASPYNGIAATTSAFEAFGGKQLALEVLKQTVTAGSRKLQAKWTIEAMQDLNASHGLDLESEITAALSAEIVGDIDREIIDDLQVLAGSAESYDMNGTFTGTPNYVGDRHAVLGVLINKVANDIARKTRRGAGNWVVVSPIVASVLQSASKSVFAPAVQGSFEGPNNTKLVGTLNGSIKVYTYISYGSSTTSEDLVLGYKGGNGETDAGYFYCPYIPLMSSNVIVDPSTWNPQISLSTRYGKCTFTNTATSLGNSADYYGTISVANLTFV